VSVQPVILGKRASQDIDDAIAYYLDEGGEHVALGFVDALQDAYALLGKHPAIGTSRYAHELSIPGLRSWALPRFPYTILYLDHESHVDVVRVLHSHRDIPAVMRESPE
jgi:toxin ParE1/3/4